jgi:hypothetical protein
MVRVDLEAQTDYDFGFGSLLRRPQPSFLDCLDLN